MKKFKSFDEYEKWLDCDNVYEAVYIDTAKTINMDATFKCKRFNTALNRFNRIFKDENDRISGFVDSMKESCQNGIFNESCFDKDNYFSYGVIRNEDAWYVFLNFEKF